MKEMMNLVRYRDDLRNSLQHTLTAIPYLRDSITSSRDSEGAVRRLGEAAMLIRTELAKVEEVLDRKFGVVG